VNKFNLATILAGCISMIAGCSTPDGNNWVKDGMPRSEAQQAYAECKYEAESSTATIGTGGRPPRTWGDAIGEGIGDGIAKGMEQSDLIKDCMRARGFTQ